MIDVPNTKSFYRLKEMSLFKEKWVKDTNGHFTNG